MRRREPHFFIHSGDNIHADGPISSSAMAQGGQLWTNLVTPEVAKVAETSDSKDLTGDARYTEKNVPLLDLFVVDMRSYRGPNSDNLQATESAQTVFLGREQLDWLRAGLARTAQRRHFGPDTLDGTFGPQVVFQKAPPAGMTNLSLCSGLQFFGEVNIDAHNGNMTVDLRDIDGVTVFSRTRQARMC